VVLRGAHNSIDAQCLRQSVDLVQIEASGPPGFAESLQRNIDADLVAKSKVVDHCTGDVINPDLAAFDVVLFDAQIEECRDSACHSHWRKGERRNARAARDGEPHLPGQLRPDLVEQESRRQADDARRGDGG
jgi:hypothetical protein